MSSIKGRLSRLKALGLVKASEIRAEAGDRSHGPAPAERETFLPGWDKIAPHTFTRTLATGLALDGGTEACFESSHFSNQRLRRKKGLGPEPPVSLPFERLSFFDLETTGLSGGTGTIAFLAAVGFFEGGDFLVTQVFMDDFPGEPAFLDFAINLLAQRPHLVTYNGAAFDVPLLRTRCIMNGIQVPEFRHIDVLQTTRRLWRRTLGSCSLQALEAGVLGEGRVDDVPGFLIPRLWLEYSGSPGETDRNSLSSMGKVVEHNALDVKSLARLLLRVEGIMEDPLSRWAGEKVYAPHLSLELIAAGRTEEGFALLEDAGANGDERALWTLARLYRRAREFEAYARIVEAMSDQWVESCVEKAKYQEHLRKDPAAALACAEKALAMLGSATRSPASGIGIREALEKRKARLESKRRAWGSDRP
ncbi:MAG: ribonuclease H-like domain-containing protein [Spirochaetales bacterium]